MIIFCCSKMQKSLLLSPSGMPKGVTSHCCKPNSQDVSEGQKSQSTEQADNESTVDIDNSSELCDECKEEVHDVCLESEDSDSEESADEEADEITEVGTTTEDTENIVEEKVTLLVLMFHYFIM